MKTIAPIFLAIIISSKVFGQAHKTEIDTINVYSINVYDKTDTWKDAKKVSIKELLKNPKKYHRKLISVYGFVSLSMEEPTRIYSSQESFENQSYAEAILCPQNREDIYVEMKNFKGGYAVITGMFSLMEGDEDIKQIILNIRRIDIPR